MILVLRHPYSEGDDCIWKPGVPKSTRFPNDTRGNPLPEGVKRGQATGAPAAQTPSRESTALAYMAGLQRSRARCNYSSATAKTRPETQFYTPDGLHPMLNENHTFLSPGADKLAPKLVVRQP